MIRNIILSAICGAAICTVPVWAQSGPVSKSDQVFLNMAAEADMTTAHLGQMAEDRSASNGVKVFGKKLTEDHTLDYSQLNALAGKAGETVPKGINTQDNRQIARLDKYKGKSFDRAFLSQEKVEHEKLVQAFKREAEHGDNADIKAYASKTLPVIEGHLHEAQDLLKPGKHNG